MGLPLPRGRCEAGATRLGMSRKQPASIDVVYLHGVGGPRLDWHQHVPAGIAATHTVDFTDLIARPSGPSLASTERSDRESNQTAPDGAQWSQPFYRRRDALAGAVEEFERDTKRRAKPPRWRAPVVVPTTWLVRSPLFNMGDAARYRSDPAVRGRIASRLADSISQCAGPVVLLAHSLGSVIAVDVLHELELRVDLLLTIGSPIGVDLDWCTAWVGSPDFPTAQVGGWLNVVNTRDPIPWNRPVEARFPQAVDAYISAGLLPFGPGGSHDPATYLRSPLVQHVLHWVAAQS